MQLIGYLVMVLSLLVAHRVALRSGLYVHLVRRDHTVQLLLLLKVLLMLEVERLLLGELLNHLLRGLWDGCLRVLDHSVLLSLRLALQLLLE